MGVSMPFALSKSVLVEDPYGGIILVGGETLLTSEGTALLRLKNLQASWEILPQVLGNGRRFHSALIIPSNYTTCTT